MIGKNLHYFLFSCLRVACFCALLALAQACNTNGKGPQDPLPSWSQRETKNAIIDYVNQVTSEESEDFVPIEKRIAVFDNDGTLWSEYPMYFQLLFALDRVQEMAPEYPEWEGKEPFKYVLGNNKDSLMAMGLEGLIDIVLATHSGNTPAEFQQFVIDWMNNSRHPITGKPYTEMVFKPMIELMDYLEEYQFKVYIVSGGGVDFMRAWAPKVYGLPKEQIIGSSLRTEFVSTDGGVRLEKMAEIDFVDDKAGKVINIQKIIGAKPIFCAGNSDGDLEMMQWTASNIHKSFKLFVHHTDGQREFSYDRNSSFGKFDRALDLAQEKGWVLVDMKNDWLEIYP